MLSPSPNRFQILCDSIHPTSSPLDLFKKQSTPHPPQKTQNKTPQENRKTENNLYKLKTDQLDKTFSKQKPKETKTFTKLPQSRICVGQLLRSMVPALRFLSVFSLSVLGAPLALTCAGLVHAASL